MSHHQRQYNRSRSDISHQNYAYFQDEEESKAQPIKKPKSRKMSFIRQISTQAEKKIDQLEQKVQDVANILQKPIFIRVISLNKEAKDVSQSNVIIESPPAAHTNIETSLTTHREMKTGKQRFRWNLLFNLLLLIIVPLPFWISFVSNTVAIYLLPSIQAVFVFMWISESYRLCMTHPSLRDLCSCQSLVFLQSKMR